MSYLLLKNNPSTEISLNMKSLRERETDTARKALDNEIVLLGGEATALELVKIFFTENGGMPEYRS